MALLQELEKFPYRHIDDPTIQSAGSHQPSNNSRTKADERGYDAPPFISLAPSYTERYWDHPRAKYHSHESLPYEHKHQYTD